VASPSKLIVLDAVDADVDAYRYLVDLIVLFGPAGDQWPSELDPIPEPVRGGDVQFEETVVGFRAGIKGEVAAEIADVPVTHRIARRSPVDDHVLDREADRGRSTALPAARKQAAALILSFSGSSVSSLIPGRHPNTGHHGELIGTQSATVSLRRLMPRES